MKPQIVLTTDQMRELESLGLDCSDASMAILSGSSVEIGDTLTNYIPTYTLEEILMKLPATLEICDSDDSFYYDLGIFPHWESELWCAKYKGHYGDLKSINARDLMKCAFEMLKWVLQNHPDKIKRL